MADAVASPTGALDYARARRILLAAGLIVLLAVSAVMYVRRVDTAEVTATLLFIPVFVAVVFWGIRGGVIAGVLAAVAYAAVRYPAVEAVGWDRFSGLLVSRAVAYVAFGSIGGWATKQLEASLTKLELYDQIDDASGLYNARFFVQDTDLEVSRSKRYQTIFSVVVVDVPADAIDRLGRQKGRVLRDVGRLLKDSVRTVDRAVHTADGTRHRFAVVLPETGNEGARIFGDRLAERLGGHLSGRGVAITGDSVTRSVVTYPDDEAGIQSLRAEFEAVDRAEHPEAHDAQQRGTGKPS